MKVIGRSQPRPIVCLIITDCVLCSPEPVYKTTTGRTEYCCGDYSADSDPCNPCSNMPWTQHISISMLLSLICFLLFQYIGLSLVEEKQREKRLAILGTTEIPAASVDLSQFNFTDLVNGMMNMAFRGAKGFFSFLSVTSYSSFAFHKVSILIYNISNLKHVDYQKFPMRYCYCLNNRTNDLTDYTVLLLDIIGNSTSSLKELFKSTSIVSVSQSNESDCIYFCVMTGRTGRNLSDLWDLTQKPPVVNLTLPPNHSSTLDLESILPNFIISAEKKELIKNVPTELWTHRTSTSSSVHEGFLDNLAVTSQETNQGDSEIGQTEKQSLGILETSVGEQSYSIFTTKDIPLRIQTLHPSHLPPLIHGVASKENKFAPTISLSLVDTIEQKAQHQPLDKLSLLPNRDQSALVLSHKAQDGSPLKLPGWTTIAALEMLQRPYTMIPLWTGNGPHQGNISVTTRMTVSDRQDAHTETGPSRRALSLSVHPRSMDTRNTMVSTWVQITSPSLRRTSLEMKPLRADSDFYDQSKLVTARSQTQVTSWKKHPLPPVTLPLLQVLLPQMMPTVDSSRISFYSHTKSRCQQTKPEVIPPSFTSVVPKITSCVMELCRFYRQCLCTSQEQYSAHKKQRHCVQFYSWYLKNATYICEKLQRKPHRHTLKQKCLANICKSI